ncbi:DUF2069 domain-containing protein [Roseateles amylovorans]|uniref:DUF2069 domain-containing protein n=1 Tax=Roseateles amylovorans TaxID=2978473 RepID=A0ABY6ATE5_9BURK|nr:DUF2069 domain-containing protein [Roseateles amylovorans]UXH76287.1 DUF2069 domain-containing protein [Roseateles amylovorans]
MSTLDAPLRAAPTPRTEPTPRERLSRHVAFGGTLSLAVLCLGWELWWAPIGQGTLAIKAVPLLLPLLGLWRYRLYTFRWLSLMVWLYMTEGLVRSTSDRGLSAGLAAGEVALSLIIFIACAAHVRQRLGEAKAKAAP